MTVKAHYSGRYERCRACGIAYALYLWTVPVETDEQKAIHAQGVVVNPYELPPVPWSCQRCGKDGTSNTPIYRADGKVCKACYDVEMEPEDRRIAEGIKASIEAQKQRQAAKDAERAAFLRRLAQEEQSINQSTE